MVKVNGRYECPNCKKSYANRQHLSRHKRDCSESTVQFTCSVCEKVYNRKDSLTRHKCKGEKVKEKVCTICNVDFPTIWRLTRHMSQKHEKENLNCKKCGKRYQRRPPYEEHMKTCTGVRLKDCQKEEFT